MESQGTHCDRRPHPPYPPYLPHLPMRKLIIAIDGPSGAGKGTVARAIASELFYGPGGATARAVQCVYHALSLPAPEPLPEIERAEFNPMFTLKRGPVKCEL